MAKIKKIALIATMLITTIISTKCIAMKNNPNKSNQNNNSYNQFSNILNKKIKREKEDIEEDESSQYSYYSQEDLNDIDNIITPIMSRKNSNNFSNIQEDSLSQDKIYQKDLNDLDNMPTPVMRKRNITNFQNNNIKDFVPNNEILNNTNPKNILFNQFNENTSKKNNLINNRFSRYEYLKNNLSDLPSNMESQNLYNIKTDINNNTTKNNFEEQERNDISVRANFGENESEEYLCEQDLNIPKILTAQQFVMEEYKKRIIWQILKKHMHDEFIELIKIYVQNSTLENKNDIIKDIGCRISAQYKLLKFPINDFSLRTTDFFIELTDSTREIFKGKDEEYRDLLLNIVSNYKIIFKKSIVKTFKELPKLTKKYFDELRNKQTTKLSCNILVKSILGEREFDKQKVYEELIKFNKNDYCYKYFTNFECLINNFHLKFPKKENCKYYETISEIVINGRSLNSLKPFRVSYIDDVKIPPEKGTIFFKNYNFLLDLDKIKFNSKI